MASRMGTAPLLNDCSAARRARCGLWLCSAAAAMPSSSSSTDSRWQPCKCVGSSMVAESVAAG